MNTKATPLPTVFIPIIEHKNKNRTMPYSLDAGVTDDTLAFLVRDGQPANIKVIMTNKCNLSCLYCFQQHTKEAILWTNETLDALFESFLKLDVSHCWNKNKTWDWFGGEPLIYKQVILDFMQRNADKIAATTDTSFAITTNATLLTEDFVKEYLQYPNTYIVVSLDTVFLDQDLRNHTAESMRNVLNALSYIAAARGPYNTTVTITINPRQITQLPHTLEALRQAGVRNILVNPLLYNKNVLEQWTLEQLTQVYEATVTFGNKHKDVVFEFGAEVAGKHTTNCLTGGKIFAVDGSGDVSGCFFFSNDKSKHGDIILANVFSGLINPEYDTLTKQVNIFYSSDERCKTCDIQDLCYVCPTGVYDTTNSTSYFRSSPVCQDLVRMSIKVSDLMLTQNKPYRANRITEYQKHNASK